MDKIRKDEFFFRFEISNIFTRWIWKNNPFEFSKSSSTEEIKQHTCRARYRSNVNQKLDYTRRERNQCYFKIKLIVTVLCYKLIHLCFVFRYTDNDTCKLAMQKRGINGIKKRKTRGAKKDTVCKDSDVQTDYHCAGARASTMWHRVKNLDLQVLLRRLACGLEKKKMLF